MRIREQIKKVSEIVKNPVIRVEFQPDTHQDYLDLQDICLGHKVNMTIFARHILVVWKRKFSSVESNDFKQKMLSEIVQSMHGITQTDIFSKYETWENIAVPAQKAEKKNAEQIQIKLKRARPVSPAKKKPIAKAKKVVKK